MTKRWLNHSYPYILFFCLIHVLKRRKPSDGTRTHSYDKINRPPFHIMALPDCPSPSALSRTNRGSHRLNRTRAFNTGIAGPVCSSSAIHHSHWGRINEDSAKHTGYPRLAKYYRRFEYAETATLQAHILKSELERIRTFYLTVFRRCPLLCDHQSAFLRWCCKGNPYLFSQSEQKLFLLKIWRICRFCLKSIKDW